MSPWQELVALAEGLSGREGLAEALPAAPPAAAPLLARLAELQAELVATLVAARDETARELGALRRGRGAVRSYAPAAAAARGGWVDETH